MLVGKAGHYAASPGSAYARVKRLTSRPEDAPANRVNSLRFLCAGEPPPGAKKEKKPATARLVAAST
jgi:hypothetical protein